MKLPRNSVAQVILKDKEQILTTALQILEGIVKNVQIRETEKKK